MKRETPQQIESRRQAIQVKLDDLRSAIQRNEMGQYATPFPLALEIVKFVQDNYLDKTQGIRFLEPAVGTGAFVSALFHTVHREGIESAVGIEVDHRFAAAARDLWGQLGLKVIEANFIHQPFPVTPAANLLITNPPYVRHHHLDRETKLVLKQRTEDAVGQKISGLAGLYCHYLLMAHRWLADDGLSVWLIPSEFMDVNYGETVKRYLTERVSLLYIHRFDSDDIQFDGALVSSAVLIFRKRPPTADQQVTFSLGPALRQPRLLQRIVQRELVNIRKWTSLPGDLHYAMRNVDRLNKMTRIGDLFDIRRGLATGANEFFILERQTAIEKRIPGRFLRPILPSPRYLKGNKIYADKDGYPLVEPSLVLLDCGLDQKETRQYPLLQVYLEWGQSQGFADRYITRSRTPWYRQEFRLPAPIVCSYMSRGKSGTSGIRFFRNYSQATAPNVYLMLYPTAALQNTLGKYPDLLDSLFQLISRASHEHLLYEGRTYGGGLNKIEPRELARVPLPDDSLIEQIGLRPRQLALLES